MSLPPYEPVTLDKQNEYLERLALCPQIVSDYSFANVWGWADEYGLEWSWGDSCVWIRQTKPVLAAWAPVGPWNDWKWSECRYLKEPGAEFIRVPEALTDIWKEQLGDRVDIREARGHWDYIYSAQALTDLKGNKYHKKKNHLNQFLKKYEHQYETMRIECVEEMLKLQKEWCEWKECEDSDPLEAENTAVFRVLTAWDRIPGLMGGSLYVDGEIVAYTVGEPLTDDTLVIHFEKAKPGYRGVYQAINQMFLENEAQSFTYVNREQDLDDPGLRKAKESYHPDAFGKKYYVKTL